MGVSKRTRQKEMRKNAVAVAIVLIFALTVFSVNSIGKFIAEKVIKPVADFSGISTESFSTATIKTDKLELFAVSIASFDTFEDAQKEFSGNYIFKLDDKFNVLHSVKTSKEEAKKTLNETDGAIITLNLDEVSIKITGTKSQTNLISSCFDTVTKNAKILAECEEKLHNGELSPLQTEAKLKTARSEISAKITSLTELNSKNVTVTALTDILNLLSSLLEDIPSSTDEKFLEKLRYSSCAYVCEYFNFLSELE